MNKIDMKRITAIFISIFLILAVAFVCCAISYAGSPGSEPFAAALQPSWADKAKNPENPKSIYPYTKHADLSPAGVSYSGYDDTKTKVIINELKRYEKEQPEDAVIDTKTALPLLVDGLFEETDKLQTQLALLDIKYYGDANNEEISELSSELKEKNIDISDQCFQVLRNVLKGPNGKLLEKELTDDEEEVLTEYEDMTAREKELYGRETDLVQEYDKLILNSTDLKKDNDRFTKILSDLVKTRNELAQIYEYDSYPDYSYTEVYYRDYTCEDAKALYADVKKYIVPLFIKCTERFYNSDVRQIFAYDDSGDEILKRIAPYIGEIDPELKTSFNYLRRNHMYNLDYSEDKMDVGFTDDLPEYGSPYIFNMPYREAADYSVTVHEFGHFNAIFHHDGHSLLSTDGSYDIAEIQSQGLELLFLDYYDELFGKDADTIKYETLTNILAGIVTGCMYDELQQAIFADPEMSGKEMNALAAKLADEYGLLDSGYYTEESAHYDWVSVTHTYESPMYYISYATSALSALDIWAESLDDRDSAVEKYMKVTALGTDKAYLEGIKECGLRNIFDDGVVKDISAKIAGEIK